jgi:hypothetical protein
MRRKNAKKKIELADRSVRGDVMRARDQTNAYRGTERATQERRAINTLQQTGGWLELQRDFWISCGRILSHAAQQSELFTRKILPSSLPSMKSPKLKRISYVKAGVLIVDQVKPAILKGTAVRFDLSKGKGIK